MSSMHVYRAITLGLWKWPLTSTDAMTSQCDKVVQGNKELIKVTKEVYEHCANVVWARFDCFFKKIKRKNNSR